jgi:hypothetical protein
LNFWGRAAPGRLALAGFAEISGFEPNAFRTLPPAKPIPVSPVIFKKFLRVLFILIVIKVSELSKSINNTFNRNRKGVLLF